MQKIVFNDLQKVINSLKDGQNIAVFTVNMQGLAENKLSDIKLQYGIKNSSLGILEPAISYIHAHYNKDIKLEQASALCDISPSYFSRLFSKRMKMGFKSYLISLRLNSAKFLLKNTNRTVVSIANECGYPDCGYFNKIFKRHLGYTPLQYRFTVK